MRRIALLAAGLVGLLLSATPAHAATGLSGRWTFDEGNGATAADASGGGNAGILSGGVSWVSGARGGALAFTGGQVRIPTRAAFETPAVTVEAWVKQTGTPGPYRYVVAKGASACMAASYGLYTGPGGGIQFYVSSAGGTRFARSPDAGDGVWDGRWHLVAGTYDGSAVRLYVDGAEVGSGTPATDPIDYGALDTRDLFVGHYDGCTGLDFVGSVDDVRIYGRALTADEVAREPAFPFKGFFAPIDNAPTLNQVKAGSAVPIKFSVGGFQGLDGLMAPGAPNSRLVTCSTSAPLDDVEQTVTAGASTLSYDAASDQYAYVWKTDKSWSGTCRQLTVTLSDGIPHTAAFKFK
jgi:hypothetical protein